MSNHNTSFFLDKIVLKDIKCFKGVNEVSFLNKADLSSKWTIILGNNNTGKSTLLRLLAKSNFFYDKPENEHGESRRDLFEQFSREQNVSGYFIVASKECNGKHSSLKPRAGYFTNLSTEIDTYGYPSQENKSQEKEIKYERFFIDGYGTTRLMSKSTLVDYTETDETQKSLFFNNVELTNAEEWLLQLDYARKSKISGAAKRLKQVTELLTGSILPDINNIKFKTSKHFKTTVLFDTAYGLVPLNGLSHGYQTTITWVVDLAKRMFDRYPDLDNPLYGPAIVLVDEIDLHLHPDWQRKLVKYLSDLFPNTQFIVTAHSPLIVQSAESVNLIMLEKDEDTGSINIRQQFGSFQGWTVEEILRELMDMGEKTRSDKYLELMRQFEDALLAEKYTDAKSAYDELDKILSPTSYQRKVLSIQLSAITPVHS